MLVCGIRRRNLPESNHPRGQAQAALCSRSNQGNAMSEFNSGSNAIRDFNVACESAWKWKKTMTSIRNNAKGLNRAIVFFTLGLPIFAHGQNGPESGETAEPRDLGEVTVRARRSIEDRFMAPGSLVVIDRRDIEAMGAFSVSDVLRQLPGVQVTPTADGGVEIRMRGMDANATQLLVDGQRVSSGKSQLPLDQLPAELIERVEVVRAPSAEFSGATGGTLNIVLRQATVKRETNIRLTDNRVWGRDAAQAFFSNSGPIGGKAGGAAAAKGKDNAIVPLSEQPWAYFVAASSTGMLLGSDTERRTVDAGKLTADTNTAGRYRRIEDTLLPRLSGYLGRNDQLALRATLSQTRFGGTAQSQGLNSVGNQAFNVLTLEDYAFRRQYQQGAADWTHRFADSKLETTVSGSQARDSVNRLGSVIDSNSTGQISDQYSAIESRKESLWSLKTKLTGTTSPLLWAMGAESEYRALNVASQNTDSLAASNSNLNLGVSLRRQILWGQNEWALAGATTLTAGLRAEELSINSDSATTLSARNQFLLQPSLHTRTPINEDLQFRFNVARVTRYPSVWDLVNRGTPAAGVNGITNPDQIGNPNLRPEVAWSFDTGLDQRLKGQGQAGLNLFVRQLQDTLATLTTLNGARWVQQRANVGDATVWGLEADAKTGLTWLGLGSDWTLSSNASLLQSRMTSGANQGNRIPGQARYTANLNVAKPLRRSGGFFGGFTLSATGPAQLNTSPGITGSEGAHTTLDLYVGSVFPTLGYWRLGIYNIGNANYARQRNYADGAGNPAQDTSDMRLTPRLYFTIGTQFCDNFKPC
jgi:outer membrane receptor protein involved in Fe transport